MASRSPWGFVLSSAAVVAVMLVVFTIVQIWRLYRQNYPLPGAGRPDEDPADEIIRRYFEGKYK